MYPFVLPSFVSYSFFFTECNAIPLAIFSQAMKFEKRLPRLLWCDALQSWDVKQCSIERNFIRTIKQIRKTYKRLAPCHIRALMRPPPGGSSDWSTCHKEVFGFFVDELLREEAARERQEADRAKRRQEAALAEQQTRDWCAVAAVQN